MNSSKSISPAVAGVIVLVVLVMIAVVGFKYLNQPAKDPIADAVAKERARADYVPVKNVPLMGAPPKAGASDYARPADSPLVKH